jgi:catecholate siderophore receptor
VVLGLEGSKETSDPTRFTWTGIPTTSLLDPDEHQDFAGSDFANSIVHTTAISAGVYGLDTIELGHHWDLTGGIRWDRFDADYHQTTFSSPIAVGVPNPLDRIDEMPSWRAALVYKPVGHGSIYFDYGTSFNPSAEALSLSVSTADTEPEKNRTFEFGTKWDLPNHGSLRGAFFYTEKTNAREPSLDNPLVNVPAGNQRVQGVEIEYSGYITRRWEVFSGYAYMDSAVIKSMAYPAAVGAQLANVPRNTFNYWNTFDLPWKFEFGGGAQYVGSRTASSTVPTDPTTGLVKQVPDYWTFSLMGKRRISEHLELQVNANNLLDRYYIDQVHPAHLVPGPGRSVSATANYNF